ncbi:DUF47 domain-containing protein [Amycolatopsis jejuensis]|uniref:DUF47 domain-containing protein n=1 Tax=Amycolatopsis jejuensis TaxID=330084 RepID=UPI00052499D6|nr:DUF47 family protein [Amycolatopsis jejuensis]
MTGVRRVLADLTGRSQRRAVAVLADQVSATVEGVRLAARMSSGELTPAQARTGMVDAEHAGDALRARLVAEISAALTTPIDREDLYRLSRSVDDVLDNVRDFVRETDLYQAVPDPADTAAVLAIAGGLDHLRRAVEDLIPHPGRVIGQVLAARKCAVRVRKHYQHSVAALFSAELTHDVLKRRELLRRLDIVGLRLGECAATLSDAMQKRGH